MGSESVWGYIDTRMSGYQDVAITNSHWQNLMSGWRGGCLDDVQMVSKGVWGSINTQYVKLLLHFLSVPCIA